MNIDFNYNSNNHIIGLKLKRKLTFKECAYILKNVFKLYVDPKNSFVNAEDYEDFKQEVVEDVNNWLIGQETDEAILVYCVDNNCTKAIGLKKICQIIDFLNKNDII